MFNLKKLSDAYVLAQSADQDSIRRDLMIFFGPRAEIFLNAYEKMRQKPGFTATTWNWATFFGGFTWFFYRKMNLIGAIAILLPLVLGLLFGGSGGSGGWAVVTLLAKPFYVQGAMRRIKQANDLGLTAAERDDYLRRAGGVSLVAGILAGILYAAIVVLAFSSIYFDSKSGS